MTQMQRKTVTWSIGAILTILGLVWAASAWATDISNTCIRQDNEIRVVDHKAIQAIEVAVETRTRMVIAENRLSILENRVDRLEDLQRMVEEMHRIIVR